MSSNNLFYCHPSIYSFISQIDTLFSCLHLRVLKYVLFVMCSLNLLRNFAICLEVKIEEIFEGGRGYEQK